MLDPGFLDCWVRGFLENGSESDWNSIRTRSLGAGLARTGPGGGGGLQCGGPAFHQKGAYTLEFVIIESNYLVRMADREGERERERDPSL